MPSTIVIADDSLYARMLVKQAVNNIFDDTHYIEAASGQEVLDKSEGQSPDWFLLDMNMGEPDGLTTAKTLAERGVDITRISLVTGNKSSDLQIVAADIHLSCINKAMSPNDMDSFIDRLRNFFQK